MHQRAPQRIRTSDQLPSDFASHGRSHDTTATYGTLTRSPATRNGPEGSGEGVTAVQSARTHRYLTGRDCCGAYAVGVCQCLTWGGTAA